MRLALGQSWGAPLDTLPTVPVSAGTEQKMYRLSVAFLVIHGWDSLQGMLWTSWELACVSLSSRHETLWSQDAKRECGGVQLVPLILTPSSPVCLLVCLLEAASRWRPGALPGSVL